MRRKYDRQEHFAKLDKDFRFAREVATVFLERIGRKLKKPKVSAAVLAHELGIHPGPGCGVNACKQAVIQWHWNAIESCNQRIKAPKEFKDSQTFHNSLAWRKVRYEVLRMSNGRCQCCGAHGSNTSLHVDHIKPRSLYPMLALDPTNLQVLCADCNMGKGATDEINWMAARRDLQAIVEASPPDEQMAHIRDILAEE